MKALMGVFPVLPTVFGSDGAVDADETLAVADYAIAAGAAGVVFPGLASEVEMLTADERIDLTQRIGARVKGRASFIVGASAATPEEAAQFAHHGAAAGADVSMVMTPQGLADDMDAMARFYDRVARESGIPVMLQNAPPPMGIGLPLEKVAAIAGAVDGVRYVKEEAQPSGQRITRLDELAGASLDAVFGGAGARYVIDELNRGATGTMPASEITEAHVSMLARHRGGDIAGARDLFDRTLPLLSMQAIFRWRLTKEVLRRRGIISSSYVRAAGPALDRHDHQELDALLARIADLLMPAAERIAADGPQ